MSSAHLCGAVWQDEHVCQLPLDHDGRLTFTSRRAQGRHERRILPSEADEPSRSRRSLHRLRR